MKPDIGLVLSQIDREELANLALALANIDSPPGQEKEVGEFVEGWLKQEGFQTRVISLLPERPNVVGMYQGSGGGYSLIFNAHMDTSVSQQDVMHCRDPLNHADHEAWREGDTLYGNGIVNDKGQMACFLIAARAIKNAGVVLKGDLLLTAVSGEIEWEPVDEFQSPQYLSNEIGSHFMVAHGVVADYALVAESSNFKLTWVQAGRAVFKVTLFGSERALYSPFIMRPYATEKNPNAIVRMAKLIDKIEDWALSYEKKHTYECPGGTLIPKVNIGAVRGGSPYLACVTSEVCFLYVDLRLAPNQDVMAVKADLEGIISSLRLEGEVELVVFRRGYEAQNIDRLAEAIEKAHYGLFNDKPGRVVGPHCSMWTDMNVFNEAGIPAATYGPPGGLGAGKFSTTIDDLYKTAQVYAMVALDLCNQEKKDQEA